MKRIFIPTQSATEWQRLLAKPDMHWVKGYSAMTTAASWEAAADHLPAEIKALLSTSADPALLDLELLAAIPEWQTMLPGGQRASCTDVLALASNNHGLCVIAVEAKVLEDFGPLVGEKRKAASNGQLERLDYLQELLGVNHFEDGIRYQLLHRTASALLTAQQFHARTAVMLIQAFETPADRQNDFNAFCTALGAESLASGVFKVSRIKAPALYLAWCAGDKKFRDKDFRDIAST